MRITGKEPPGALQVQSTCSSSVLGEASCVGEYDRPCPHTHVYSRTREVPGSRPEDEGLSEQQRKACPPLHTGMPVLLTEVQTKVLRQPCHSLGRSVCVSLPVV